MKGILLLIPVLLMNACKTTSEITSGSSNNPVTVENINSCPEEGSCKVSIHKHTILQIKEDGTGAIYPELSAGNAMVVEYSYMKKGPEGTADGDYSETIHFEIPASTHNLKIEGEALQEIKLLYGKQCYCKGEAGYYPVTIGKLELDKASSSLRFKLEFEVNETSHVVYEIAEMIKL